MKTLTLSLLFGALALAGCKTVTYEDPNSMENLDTNYGVTDLKILAGDMAQSLIADPNLNYLEHPGKADDQRIVAYIGGVDNRTSEHIDTEAITDSIKTAMHKSGKFRIVAGDQGQGEIADQVRFQQGSGRVDPELAKAFGKQLGADVILYGRLINLDKVDGHGVGSRKDVYYKFTLQCVNIESGELIWIEESEVRKMEKTSIF